MSTHTKGPWFADCDDFGCRVGTDVGIGDIVDYVESESAEANARLIAAAPELLDALIEVLDAVGFLGGGDWELEGYGIDEKRGAEIRALIAKARGEVS